MERLLPQKGTKYNLLTLTGNWIGRSRYDGGKSTFAEAICDCNRKRTVWKSLTMIKSGRTKSCGCLNIISIKKSNTKHGLRNHPLYDIWRGMKKRTLNVGSHNYHLYGQRGIKVCRQWLNDFEKFYIWSTNNGYKKSLSIDRINTNGDYKPNNCRWATAKKQCRNKRNSISYKGVYGEDRSLELGGARTLVPNRIRTGWSKEKAFNTPLRIRTTKL